MGPNYCGFQNGSLIVKNLATSRANLGLGTLSTQNSNNVNITDGVAALSQLNANLAFFAANTFIGSDGVINTGNGTGIYLNNLTTNYDPALLDYFEINTFSNQWLQGDGPTTFGSAGNMILMRIGNTVFCKLNTASGTVSGTIPYFISTPLPNRFMPADSFSIAFTVNASGPIKGISAEIYDGDGRIYLYPNIDGSGTYTGGCAIARSTLTWQV